jgi:hypothetical protein
MITLTKGGGINDNGMKTQQDIINENIIEQLQIRILQDKKKIDELEKDCRAWQSEYRAGRAEVERLKQDLDKYRTLTLLQGRN